LLLIEAIHQTLVPYKILQCLSKVMVDLIFGCGKHVESDWRVIYKELPSDPDCIFHDEKHTEWEGRMREFEFGRRIEVKAHRSALENSHMPQ
jgi:hypothetical protein